MSARRLRAAVAVALLCQPALSSGAVAATPSETVEATLAGREAALIEIRHDLHRHPELSGQEARTAKVVSDRLTALGLEVRAGVGGHGVVGVLRGAKPGPVVAVRADMDAVRSEAPDPVDYRSETPGVRHICGHDVHTTVVLGVAEALAAVRKELAGTVVFLFQPAEENVQGARAMMADGALDDPRPEASFAFHTAPHQVGQIGSKSGLLLAGRDQVIVVLEGGEELEAAGAELVSAIGELNTLSEEEMRGSVVGDFRAAQPLESRATGDGEWSVSAQLTCSSDSLRKDARARIEAKLAELQSRGVRHDLTWVERISPGVTNDARIELAAREAIRAVVGDSNLVISRGVPPMFSEDFGVFLDVAPGAMFWLGVSNAEAGTLGLPHSPGYVADDRAILVGARVMSAVVLDYMARHPKD